MMKHKQQTSRLEKRAPFFGRNNFFGLKFYRYNILKKLVAIAFLTAMIGILQEAKCFEFPVIVYSLDPATDVNFKLARSLGFNTAHTYHSGSDDPKSIEQDCSFLELAQTNGMKVMFNLNGKKWVKDTDGGQAFRSYIRKFKKNSAISIWYLCDEPSIEAIPALRKLYRILKDETPDIPVAIAMNWNIDFMRYSDIYDIILPDVYPVSDQSFPNAPIYHLSDFAGSLLTIGKPVIPVAQLFNWKILPEKAQTRMSDPANCRYPNATELRYWLYTSTVQGCSGIAFYSFYHSLIQDKVEAESWTEKVLGPVLREYLNWYGNGFIQHQEFKRFHDTRLRGMIGRNATGEFLVLINDWPLKQNIKKRYMEELIGNASLIPVGTTRKVNAVIQDGMLKIEEEIQPWETMVWKINRQTQEN